MKIIRLLILLGIALAASVSVQAQFGYTINAGEITITNYTGSEQTVVIPATITGLPVTSIGYQAFCFTSVTNVTIPASVTSIGQRAFAFTALTSVTIPGNVADIGPAAFNACNNLSGLTIGDGVRSIGEGAFAGSYRLTSVTIPGSVTNIGFAAFSSDFLLTNVTISAGVPNVGGNAFSYCSNLTSVTIPPGVMTIGADAFINCIRLTNVTIAGSVTNIGPGRSDGVSLQNATIGNGVADIGAGAFQECFRLTNVIVPASVTNLADSVFEDCVGLAGVFFQGNAPAIGTNEFGGGSYGDDPVTVYYLPGATGWGSTFAGRPTLLWNPQIQAGGANVGVRSNQFGFNITGTPNIPVLVETAPSAAGPLWIPLRTVTLTNGSAYFSDPVPPNAVRPVLSP